MIVRGRNEDVQINRTGQLAPRQLEHLQALRPFRLVALPSVVVGAVLVGYGALRGDVVGWVLLALGLYMTYSGWLRYRQQNALKAGEIGSFVGVLEQIKATPFRSFEAELTIDGQGYVLLALPGEHPPLTIGTRYRSYVVRGIARMGIIVAMEDA